MNLESAALPNKLETASAQRFSNFDQGMIPMIPKESGVIEDHSQPKVSEVPSPNLDMHHSSSRQALIREKKRSSTYSQKLKLDLKERDPLTKEENQEENTDPKSQQTVTGEALRLAVDERRGVKR